MLTFRAMNEDFFLGRDFQVNLKQSLLLGRLVCIYRDNIYFNEYQDIFFVQRVLRKNDLIFHINNQSYRLKSEPCELLQIVRHLRNVGFIFVNIETMAFVGNCNYLIEEEKINILYLHDQKTISNVNLKLIKSELRIFHFMPGNKIHSSKELRQSIKSRKLSFKRSKKVLELAEAI